MIDKATLRALIRDVIATEVAAAKAGGGPTATLAASPSPSDDRTVRIASDADLNAFAKRVLSLAAEPSVQQSIAAGTYGFRLDGSASTPSGGSSQVSGSTLRINEGVVTETMLNRLAKGITKIQLAPGVSLTPLAKDRVRSLNLTIERTKK